MNENQKQPPKQVIVIRKDLNMRKGKIAAQAAHASMKVLLDCGGITYGEEGLGGSYPDYFTINLSQHTMLRKWLEGKFTKICVSVDSEEELLDIYQKAKDSNVLAALITDAGLTEFGGVPTNTCIAIGPDVPEKINLLTGHLKLL